MNVEELEIKVKELENQIKSLRTLQDIEEIKKLQKAFGYYLIYCMHEELTECLANNPDTTLDFPEGKFLGKHSAKRFIHNMNRNNDPEFMHQLMQISGIVNIDPDGKTAKGRWWGFGAMAIPAGSTWTQEGEGVDQVFSCGIYEMEYIREDNIWKILRLKWVPVYSAPPGEGWVKPERRMKQKTGTDVPFPESWGPDGPPTDINYEYPSGYILPFHYKHPVTGKETTEGIRNASLKGLRASKE